MAKIHKLLHSAISVVDIERSISFYRDALGLELLFGPTVEASGEELSRSLGVENTRLRQAVLRVPGTDDHIELLEYSGDEKPVRRQLPQNTPGHAHIAFQVDDMKGMIERLEGRGVDFLPGPTRIDEGPLAGWSWLYLKDPEGTVIELVEIGE
jgi:catechol 2,3-dioxygenase-like lactoylglutathione lyase family enzyme